MYNFNDRKILIVRAEEWGLLVLINVNDSE